MASKEEIEKRVQDEAQSADDRYTKHKGDVVRSFQAAVRPLVERVIELEEEGAKHTALTVKLAQAEQRVIEQGRTIEVLNADRSRLSGSLAEVRADLRTAMREHDERAAEDKRTIAELRIGLAGERRQAEIANDVIEQERATSEALRAQVAALTAVIDGHEQAIRDACADERESFAAERLAARVRHDRLIDKLAALETTVDVLAGRLAQKSGG